MAREHNWADNYSFTAARIHRPATIAAACAIVAAAPRIRAVGTRHSFNGIADSAEMIDLGGIPADIVIDAAGGTATVGAACQYGALARHLHAAGHALHNMGSLPNISVAGATATGTHGSGDRNANLSSAVCGLELIDAQGRLRRVRRGEDGFDGMVVGLGAFGVVTRVSLDIQPSFLVRQDAYVDLPWEALIERFDTVMSAAYSVSLLTTWSRPSIGRLWVKTRLADAAALAADVAHLGALADPASVAQGVEDPLDRLNPFGVAGPWSEHLPHFRHDREPGQREQIQSEYMVPRGQARSALLAMRAMAGRIDEHLLATEIRTMAGDDLWLSPSFGHDSVAIHFTWKRAPAAVAALTREIEDVLLPLGARPHWGKLMHAGAAQAARLYPRLEAFRALAGAWDPAGKFRNEFLDRHVFGSAA